VAKQTINIGLAANDHTGDPLRIAFDKANDNFDELYLGRWNVLSHSAVAVAHTGTVAETTLATITVPAGAMGANGMLRITQVWSFTATANAKTMRTRFGGTQHNVFLVNTAVANSRFQLEIHNVNSAAVQKGAQANTGGWTGTTSALTAGAINTALAQNITLTAVLGLSSETMTLESYTVEVLYQA